MGLGTGLSGYSRTLNDYPVGEPYGTAPHRASPFPDPEEVGSS